MGYEQLILISFLRLKEFYDQYLPDYSNYFRIAISESQDATSNVITAKVSLEFNFDTNGFSEVSILERIKSIEKIPIPAENIFDLAPNVNSIERYVYGLALSYLKALKDNNIASIYNICKITYSDFLIRINFAFSLDFDLFTSTSSLIESIISLVEVPTGPNTFFLTDTTFLDDTYYLGD